MEGRSEGGREFKALCFLLLRYVLCCWAKSVLLGAGSGKAGSLPCCVPMKCSSSWKKTPPKLIIGQARKEGKECCFSDGRLPVGLRGFSGDVPKLPWCRFSVLSLSQAERYERNSWNNVLLWGEFSYLCSVLVTIWHLCCQWLIQLLSKCVLELLFPCAIWLFMLFLIN